MMVPTERERRRRSGTWWQVWGRDVGLVAITGLLLVAMVSMSQKVSRAELTAQQNQDRIERQQESRNVALSIMCGGLSAVSDAGRKLIVGGPSMQSSRFERELEKLGYPPRAKRRAAALASARAYASNIAEAIRHESGVSGVVKRDGTFDCDAVRRAVSSPR